MNVPIKDVTEGVLRLTVVGVVLGLGQELLQDLEGFFFGHV
jgi:hypothetical protein